MAKTIFDNPEKCTIDDCEMYHCCVCGKHVNGPVWGKVVCAECIETHHEAQQNGSLTPEDIEKWEKAFRVRPWELSRSF